MTEEKMTQEKEQDRQPAGQRPVMTEGEQLRLLQAERVVRRHVLYSLGLGLIPVPLVDTGTVSLIQLKMLYKLSRHYKVPFYKNLVKSLIAPLIGFVSGNAVARSVVPGLMKLVPGVQWVGMASMSVFSGAATYAIGSIFVQHFEAGGTFLDFKPENVKTHFSRLYQEGIDRVKELNKKK